MLFNILIIVASYFIGSIPFGLFIARIRGVDLRAAGSGNIGATNVGRLLGKKVGVLVFLLDFAKGAGPVAVARWVSPDECVAIAAGLTAVLGHVFPVWLKFQGGKGVATGTGAMAVLLPLPTLGAFLVWLAVLGCTRYVSLASLLAAAALFGLRLLAEPEPFAPRQRILTGCCLLAVALVAARHRGNVARLIRGRENQIPESPAMNSLARVVHILALGLWFGGGAIFSFLVAVQLFAKLEALGATPPGERPEWLMLSASFDKAAGTRLAGETISPMFARYFAVQGVCGFLALVTALSFHPDGSLLTSIAWEGVLRLWDPATGRQLMQLPLAAFPRFSSRGRYLGFLWQGKQVQLLEVTPCREYRTFVSSWGTGQGDYHDGAISPDGRLLALGNGRAGDRLWELSTGRELAVLPTASQCVLFRSDGRELRYGHLSA